MWLKKLVDVEKACLCREYFPKNTSGREFREGSIWLCDDCGRGYLYKGITVVDSGLGTTKDVWERLSLADNNDSTFLQKNLDTVSEV